MTQFSASKEGFDIMKQAVQEARRATGDTFDILIFLPEHDLIATKIEYAAPDRLTFYASDETENPQKIVISDRKVFKAIVSRPKAATHEGGLTTEFVAR